MEDCEQDSQQHIDVFEATRVLESFDIDCSGILSSELSTDHFAQHDVTRLSPQHYKQKGGLGKTSDPQVSNSSCTRFIMLCFLVAVLTLWCECYACLALQDVTTHKRRCEELEAALSRSEAAIAAERERAHKHERDAVLLREVLYETLVHSSKNGPPSAQSAAEHLQGASLL